MTISTEMMMYVESLSKRVEYTRGAPDNEEGWQETMQAAYMLLCSALWSGRPLMAESFLRAFLQGRRRMTEDNIRELAKLERNWDSHGAEPVSPGAIEAAIGLCRVLAKCTDMGEPTVVCGTPDGNVGLEWADGEIMEIHPPRQKAEEK